MLKSLKGALQRKIQFRFHNVQWGEQSLEPTLPRNVFQASSSEEGFVVEIRLQNSRFFFSKSVKKSVKRGVGVLRARSAQASLSQSRSLFSASFKTFCLTARGYLNRQR